MRRATITIPDDLNHELEEFFASQEAPLSLTNVVQTALRNYIAQRKWIERGYKPPSGVFNPPVSSKGSGKRTISAEHDIHLDG